MEVAEWVRYVQACQPERLPWALQSVYLADPKALGPVLQKLDLHSIPDLVSRLPHP